MTSINVRRLAAIVDRTRARVIEQLGADGYPHRYPEGAAALQDMRLPWYQIRAADDRGDPDAAADVFVFDEIGGSLGVSAEQFVTDLNAITANRINVRINSPGGNVYDAITIHSALLHHPAAIRTYVDGIAASAASIIAMGANFLNETEDTGGVIMMPGSQMMIHDASMMDAGNAEDHRKAATFLDRQSANLVDIYTAKAGADQDWRALMLEETWAFASEAVGLGLADRVDDPRRKDSEAEQLMSRSHDAYIARRYRYAGRAAAPAPGSVSTTPARAIREARAVVVDRSPAQDRAQAALARRAAAPGVTPGLLRDSRMWALGTAERRLPFAAQMRAETVERDGRPFYRVEGYASVFDTPYPMWDEFGPYDEIVVAGAADDTLAAKPHVVFLANHGGLAMASTKNGTLELSTDRTGLKDVAFLNPERTDVSDLVQAIQDETIEEQSFAFYITEGLWAQDFTQFRIMAFDIHRGDVSAVNYGANPHTSIAARQREIFAELRRMGPAQARAAARLLGADAVAGPTVDDLFRRYVDVEKNVEKVGTSLAHRWAQLMSDDSE